MAVNQQHGASGRKTPLHSVKQSISPSPDDSEEYSIGELRDEVSGYVSRSASQIGELARDREGSAVLVSLVAGFGVGLLIGGAWASSHRRPRTWRERIAAEGIGRRLLERVEDVLPDALTNRLGR